MDEYNQEPERKLAFYESVYIPYMKDTLDEFIFEISKSKTFISDRKNRRALELINDMAILLREPRILDGEGKYN